MKFGIREICDVVLRAKAAQKIGNKVFYKNEPVLYFDSLKTSSMEGAATTVYAQGGRGNSRLIAWEGERTVTFTMEDALISPMGFSVLTGAGLIEAGNQKSIITHRTEQVQVTNVEYTDTGTDVNKVIIQLSEKPYVGKGEPTSTQGFTYVEKTEDDEYESGAEYYSDKNGTTKVTDITNQSSYESYFEVPDHKLYKKEAITIYTNDTSDTEDYIYVMLLDDNGEVVSEPYIASENIVSKTQDGKWQIEIVANEDENSKSDSTYGYRKNSSNVSVNNNRKNDLSDFTSNSIVLVDYYVEHKSGAFQIDITPDKFGGNFYLEASTLFRTTQGVDMPAEFVIPNCKIQSNFTFTMASSGDPSTFTFTMDAFPDYTRWDRTKKVFAAIQVIDTGDTNIELERLGTYHDYSDNKTEYDQYHKPFIEFD